MNNFILCIKCGENRESDSFSKRVWSNGRVGHHSYCNSCRNKMNVQRLHELKPSMKYIDRLEDFTEDQKRLRRNEQNKQWRNRNKKKYRQSVLNWRLKNRPKVSFFQRSRELKKKEVGGSHTFNEWLTLKEKYNYMCLCCKKAEPEIKLTIDHIVPISKGGSDDIENIQPLCGSCNSQKYVSSFDYRTNIILNETS